MFDNILLLFDAIFISGSTKTIYLSLPEMLIVLLLVFFALATWSAFGFTLSAKMGYWRPNYRSRFTYLFPTVIAFSVTCVFYFQLLIGKDVIAADNSKSDCLITYADHLDDVEAYTKRDCANRRRAGIFDEKCRKLELRVHDRFGLERLKSSYSFYKCDQDISDYDLYPYYDSFSQRESKQKAEKRREACKSLKQKIDISTKKKRDAESSPFPEDVCLVYRDFSKN